MHIYILLLSVRIFLSYVFERRDIDVLDMVLVNKGVVVVGQEYILVNGDVHVQDDVDSVVDALHLDSSDNSYLIS